MVDALLEGLGHVFTVEGLWLLLLGTWYGMLVGVLPGVSGGLGLILMIPVTFGWPLESALIFFAAAWGGTSYGGAVTAILLGVPGETSNAATALDGYPLARQGRAAYALGASALATAAGASIGVLVLVALIPILNDIVLLFGPAEFFAMGLLGIAVIVVVSGRHLVKGLVAGALGLLLGVHGYNPVTGTVRFDFDLPFLTEGIPLLPAFVGMFALSQAVDLLLNHRAVAAGDSTGVRAVGSLREMFRGMGAVVRHFWLFLRSSVIGTVVGAIPGPGGAVATYLAYGQAMQGAKDRSKFGKGDIRGVIAPEAANDAKDGGALIPTLAFGVPGTLSAGIVLLALQFHGVKVGPDILGPSLPIAFVLIGALFLSNWVTSITGVFIGAWAVRVTTVSTTVLAPIIIVISVLGAYATRQLFADVIVMFIFGVIGYVFIRRDIPTVPLVIGLLLAKLLETSFHQAFQIGDRSLRLFLERPIAIGILVVTVVAVGSVAVSRRRKARADIRVPL